MPCDSWLTAPIPTSAPRPGTRTIVRQPSIQSRANRRAAAVVPPVPVASAGAAPWIAAPSVVGRRMAAAGMAATRAAATRNVTTSAATTPPRPSTPIASPPSGAPSSRARLEASAPRPFAVASSSGGTRAGMSAV